MQILVGIVDMINGDLHPSDADVIPTYACNGLSVSVIYGQAWDVTSRLRAQMNDKGAICGSNDSKQRIPLGTLSGQR